MTTEQAIMILDPDAEPVWKGTMYDSLKCVNEACRKAVEALKILNPMIDKPMDYTPTNAEIMLEILLAVIRNGKDEDGYPNVEYGEIAALTELIACPYINQPLCKIGNNPDRYRDCDDCKAHWLTEKYEE